MKIESYVPYALDGVRIVFIFLFAWVLTIVMERTIRTFRKYSVRNSRSGTVTPDGASQAITTISHP